MSAYDGLGLSDSMLDSLNLQLREAELRRAEAERAHQVNYYGRKYVKKEMKLKKKIN